MVNERRFADPSPGNDRNDIYTGLSAEALIVVAAQVAVSAT